MDAAQLHRDDPYGSSHGARPPDPPADADSAYRNFTDADLEAIFSYLQTLAAIRNRVPEPLPPAAAVAVR